MGEGRLRTTSLAALLIAACAHIACPQQSDPASEALAEVQQSHIEGNVPPAAEFDQILKRDLAAYFGGGSAEARPVVEYRLLREAPTQSGVAYPKYYVWVRVESGGANAREGAARLAAVDRERFEVTDFLSREQIAADPGGIYQVFPAPVCERIEEEMRR